MNNIVINKNIITILVAIVLLAGGYQTQNHYCLYAGLFAFSGAITNWLAIHMLFEKVPLLYGSGVIPARFQEFKAAIKQLMMEQFFTQANIDKFINKELSSGQSLNLESIIATIDFTPTFDALVEVIMQSQFASMLAMVGGAGVLQPLKEPFVEKIQTAMIDMSNSDHIKAALKDQLETPAMMDEIRDNVEKIIDQRLSELTPRLVKEMVQQIIKEHLGWLVIWGGVFGGLIGLVTALFA